MASAGLVVRDSGIVRPALSSKSGRLSSGQTASSSFSDIGIVLPSLHLGSFSNMTLTSLPGTPDTSVASSPDKQLAQDPSSLLAVDGRSPTTQPRGDQQQQQLTADNLSSWQAQDAVGRGAPGDYSAGSRRPSSSSQLSRLSASGQLLSSSPTRLDQSSALGGSSERAHTPSTIAGGSYNRMLPTPIASTVSSSQTGRTPTQEDVPTIQQQPQRATSLSLEDEDDEEENSFNPPASPPVRSANSNGRSISSANDRARANADSGTPQLKVVNGQHATPRRVESVEYATGSSPNVYDSPSSWIPSPSSSTPYQGPSTRGSTRQSSPPPPRGAAPPETSQSMYMPSSQNQQYQQQQHVSYPIADASMLPPAHSQTLPTVTSSRTPRPVSQSRAPQTQSYASAAWQGPYPPLSTPPQSSQMAGMYSSRVPPPSAIPVGQPAPVQQAQFAQKVVPPEEVCIECMMRDRDMADVDVTGPGVWERESDVWYEELVRREVEEARRGIVPSENSGKPRAKGGLLTEANVAVWLTMVSAFFPLLFLGSGNRKSTSTYSGVCFMCC